MSPETHEYEDWTLPHHVESFLKRKAEERALKVLDDAEMREIEPWQYFWPNPDFTPVNTTK